MAGEIKWALKIVKSHFSFCSCLDINELFRSMFSGSHIAKSFKLSKTKCAYLINFGIVLYFKEVLRKEIINAPVFSLLFDESMNHILQNEQLDIHKRFWDDSKCMAVTRYFDSHFPRRPNADNIVTKLQQSLQKIVAEKMIQLSMDGPATNWSVFEKMSDQRKNDEIPCLENIGSCGLHTVSNTLQNGAKKNGWKLDEVLKSMWKLFQDSPALKDIYFRENKSTIFPMKFCLNRWVENVTVAERDVNTWFSVLKVVKYYEGLAPSKRPKNKSYETLVKCVKDQFMIIKFHFFKDIADQLQTFLKRFQTDAPIVPLMSDTLETLMRRFLKIFTKNTIVDDASTPYPLLKINVNDRDNQLPWHKISKFFFK